MVHSTLQTLITSKPLRTGALLTCNGSLRMASGVTSSHAAIGIESNRTMTWKSVWKETIMTQLGSLFFICILSIKPILATALELAQV
jgi:hypothetical protein